MTTKGLFNYSAADAYRESPLNSDPSNLFNEFGFTAIRTSLASYEDKLCLSTGDRIAFSASNEPFSKRTCVLGSPLPPCTAQGSRGGDGSKGSLLWEARHNEKPANAPA